MQTPATLVPLRRLLHPLPGQKVACVLSVPRTLASQLRSGRPLAPPCVWGLVLHQRLCWLASLISHAIPYCLPACPPCRKTWPQAATRSAPETSMVSQTLLGRWAYRHGQCSISRVSLFCRESLKHRPTVTFLYHKNIELREPISGVVGLGSC